MPSDLLDILEPNTSELYERLRAVERFIDAGYEVHLNFSPVIICDGWIEKYKELFETVNYWARTYAWDTDNVKAEVIFLTHNEKKHEYNLANDLPGEDLLWTPKWQEEKVSQYGGNNIRYNGYIKGGGVHHFVELHREVLPWMPIRYIF